jgi:predicted nucleic acid-binding protein
VRAVVDTNVIAYFALGTAPFRQECDRFWRQVEEPVAPASWEAELVNVMWMAVRKEVVSLQEALHRLELIKELGIRSIEVTSLWHGALTRASTSGVSAYDTLFVELGEREALPVATFDEELLKKFPRIAKRPRAISRGA